MRQCGQCEREQKKRRNRNSASVRSRPHTYTHTHTSADRRCFCEVWRKEKKKKKLRQFLLIFFFFCFYFVWFCFSLFAHRLCVGTKFSINVIINLIADIDMRRLIAPRTIWWGDQHSCKDRTRSHTHCKCPSIAYIGKLKIFNDKYDKMGERKEK